MELSVDVVDLVSTLLDSEKYKDTLELLNNKKYINAIKDSCSEVISIIIGKIQDDTIILKPSLYGICEQLLSALIEKLEPTEALLEFIEQVELAKNDAQFGLILTPLQQILKQCSNKRSRSLEWCLNSISSYIENLPIPEYDLEREERLLLDSDPSVRRIIKVYSLLPQFYSPFVHELNVPDVNLKTKEIITSFLISLLGKPLLYIDVDPETHGQSEARQNCKTIIEDICTLEKNVLKFLEYVIICHKDKHKTHSKTRSIDEDLSTYGEREKINMTTLSGLFYVSLSGHFEVPSTAFPQVYNTVYLANTVLFCAVHLFQFTEYGPLSKGMALCTFIFNNLPNNLSHRVLSSPVHYELCKCLLNIGIYSNHISLRKDAVSFIVLHVNKLEYKGRYMLIKYIIDVANHSGMIGYAITLFKNTLNDAFKESELPDCFIGVQLFSMIKKICHLPHGAESDIVELADQIIAALNCLRFIVLKDKENITGFRSYFKTIEKDYLDVLRTGLCMSKAHYEEKLKEIEQGKTVSKSEVKVSINIVGQILEDIPAEKKIEVIHSALNAFHLIEGLVARVSECINITRLEDIKMNHQ